ncbi:MAG: response regulator [Candidatus Micrarchaeota archaeon]|nr:response regulator [Candidatus Micrarchaeota archaeon]
MAKSILVVDDDFDDLTTMKMLLEKSGYRVVPTTNGAKALDLLKGNGFSLILIDIQMPTLSGYDLLRLMRERINHNAKMAFVSILPKGEVEMGDVDGFIQKPFSPAPFIAEVKRMLK